MDPNGRIYRDLEEKIPAEDKARLDGYLRGRAESLQLEARLAERHESEKELYARLAAGEKLDAASEHAEKRSYSIAVDFDGVIHSYTSPWVDPQTIPDPPVPGAIDWLNEMNQRFRVIIFTTRGKTAEGRDAVEDFLRDHGYAGTVEVTAEKPPALIYLDDRAVRFDGEHFPTADEIHRAYIPWNKRSK